MNTPPGSLTTDSPKAEALTIAQFNAKKDWRINPDALTMDSKYSALNPSRQVKVIYEFDPATDNGAWPATDAEMQIILEHLADLYCEFDAYEFRMDHDYPFCYDTEFALINQEEGWDIVISAADARTNGVDEDGLAPVMSLDNNLWMHQRHQCSRLVGDPRPPVVVRRFQLNPRQLEIVCFACNIFLYPPDGWPSELGRRSQVAAALAAAQQATEADFARHRAKVASTVAVREAVWAVWAAQAAVKSAQAAAQAAWEAQNLAFLLAEKE